MEYCIETLLSIITQDFENLAEEHLIAESNEQLWAKGATTEEEVRMHLENAEMHSDLYDMYKKLAKNPGSMQRYL